MTEIAIHNNIANKILVLREAEVIESYRWFTVIRLLPPERIAELLSDDLIARLRFDLLKKQYTFIKDELPKALQDSR